MELTEKEAKKVLANRAGDALDKRLKWTRPYTWATGILSTLGAILAISGKAIVGDSLAVIGANLLVCPIILWMLIYTCWWTPLRDREAKKLYAQYEQEKAS